CGGLGLDWLLGRNRRFGGGLGLRRGLAECGQLLGASLSVGGLLAALTLGGHGGGQLRELLHLLQCLVVELIGRELGESLSDLGELVDQLLESLVRQRPEVLRNGSEVHDNTSFPVSIPAGPRPTLSFPVASVPRSRFQTVTRRSARSSLSGPSLRESSRRPGSCAPRSYRPSR